MGLHAHLFGMAVVVATYVPFCTPKVQPAATPSPTPLTSLWREPSDLNARDLFSGPWDATRAPDPNAVYTFVERKRHGVNPGMTVRDAAGRKWSVKQCPFDTFTPEAPIEVVLSRVLSAVGYHQPPVYYLRSFTLADDWGTHRERGGRFRLHEKTLKDVGEWSWQQNPFVGTEPYQGLLAILLMFNASDLKNSNNTLYEHSVGDFIEPWYVVRDLGTALGSTGRIAPMRGDPELFERDRFILGVRDGHVLFNYRGWHQEIVRDRLRPADAGWASALLSRLSDRQWRDAFRAAEFDDVTAGRFIAKLKANIADGHAIGGSDRP
jgi:hypothetical protein